MKTLYININNEEIQSVEELVVLPHRLDIDMLFYIGEEIANGCRIEDERKLITDFNILGNENEYKQFIEQMDELKFILFGNECIGCFEFKLPAKYLDWLKYSSEWYDIYTKNFSNGKSSVTIDLKELYDASVKNLQKEILRKLERNNLYLEIDEIVFNDDAVTRKSPIVRTIKEKYEYLGFKENKKWNKTSLRNNSDNIQTFCIEGFTFRLKYVRGGAFLMGGTDEQGFDSSDCERPIHKECINDFFMMEHCVTQKLWNIMMKGNPSAFKGDNRPVTNITYYDCLDFINKLNNRLNANFRLPSEAEWEYAARGGNSIKKQTKYSGGNILGEIAWYEENSNNVTHDVMKKKPNALGLYDMSGNVWEWCASRNKPYAPRNNYKLKNYYINRGGCATSTAKGCRTSRRYCSHPNHSSCYLGFRLVL